MHTDEDQRCQVNFAGFQMHSWVVAAVREGALALLNVLRMLRLLVIAVATMWIPACMSHWASVSSAKVRKQWCGFSGSDIFSSDRALKLHLKQMPFLVLH